MHPQFPNLDISNLKRTSDATDRYNCIAWAMHDNSRWWWPRRGAFWPRGAPTQNTIEAFELAFALKGWELCDNGDLEQDFEKVALFANGDEPTHAARLLQNGYWTSKLGRDIDISHTENELSGPFYGNIVRYFRRAL